MSTASLNPASVTPSIIRTPWIISRRQDLIWFIGSGGIGYAALGLMALGFPLTPLQLFWFFLVDGPHVLSTVTRTYCDSAERAKLGRFLWMPVPLMLIGPVMTMGGLYALFTLLAVCWQHFHIVKQHFGFMMLYKAKLRDRNDFWLDRIFLLASLFLPLMLFVLKTRPALTAALNSLPAPLPWLPNFSLALYGSLTLTWLIRQGEKWHKGLEMNWPKIGLLATVVPLQWLALTHAAQYGPDGILRAGITLGLFHSFQYHRLMWFHNKNRYSEDAAPQRYGLAAKLAPSVGVYLAIAIGLHFLTTFVPQAIFPFNQVVSASVWGIAFTHYCLDARIWHVRGDKGLARALNMA